MTGWYFDKKELRNTPSIQDGIDYETEMRYRKEGALLISTTGSKMDLGYNTTATGVVYFHRFYMFHSFRQFPRYVTACCCLLLAGKVEETPKKCKDIIKTARSLLSEQKFATFGADPKEEVMTLERILLQTIKFDLQVEHPYSYLLKYAKCLKGDKTKLQKMVQMAWTFVNDSLSTTLALQWEPEIIAVALLYLAGKLSKFEVVDWIGRIPKHLRWWDMFVEDVTMDLLEDICHQVLDLYSQPATNLVPDSPPLQPRPSTHHDSKLSSNGDKVMDITDVPLLPLPPPPPQQPQQPIVPPSTALNTKLPPPPDMPQYAFQTFTGAPPPPFPPTYAPPPHLAAPPPPPTVFPPFVAHPPPFPPTATGPGAPPPPPAFYQATPPPGQAPPPPPPQRNYYPPS